MKTYLKKIISGMIAASIMTAAIFSANAALATDGNYDGIHYYGELQLGLSTSNIYAKGTTSRTSGGNGFTGVTVYATGNKAEGSIGKYTDYKGYSTGGSYAEVYLRSGNVNGGMGSIDGAVGQHYVTSKSVDSAFTTYGNYSYLFDYYDL